MFKLNLFITFLGLLVLSGCGQTGSLYLPQQPPDHIKHDLLLGV